MSASEDYERWKGYAAWNVDGAYEGHCRGGPYDGQKLKWNEPRYPIQMFCSTAEYTREHLQQVFDNIEKYHGTEYVFSQSTWVWMGK